MKRKKVNVKKNNTKIAVFFVIFVCLVILTSFILKATYVVQQSRFDGDSRFTISISNNKKLQILSFSPNTNSISIIKLAGEIENLNIRQLLAIPIDGFVQADFLDINKGAAALMSSIFWDFGNVKTNLTIIDILRLTLFFSTVSSKNVITLDISTSLTTVDIDKIIGEFLSDEKIEKEDLSIEIINATSVTGLGARLARLITNTGGKVVQVSSENVSRQKSMILYNGDITYTVKKLSKVLGFKLVQMNRQSIGDITIIIGEDSKNPESF